MIVVPAAALLITLGCLALVLRTRRRLAALERELAAARAITAIATRPASYALPPEQWRRSYDRPVGVGWGRPRLVASRRDGMFDRGSTA